MNIYVVLCHNINIDFDRIEKIYSSIIEAESYVEDRMAHIRHLGYEWKWEYKIEEHELS